MLQFTLNMLLLLNSNRFYSIKHRKYILAKSEFDNSSFHFKNIIEFMIITLQLSNNKYMFRTDIFKQHKTQFHIF